MTTITRQPLTQRQRQVYDYIAGHVELHGYAPTYETIMRHFGWATKNSVACHVRPLIRKGWIEVRKANRGVLFPTGGDE